MKEDSHESKNTNTLSDSSFLLEVGGTAVAGYYAYQEARKAAFNRMRNVVFRKKYGLDWRDLQEKDDKEGKKYLKEFEDKEISVHISDLEIDKKITSKEAEYLQKLNEYGQEALKREAEYNKVLQSLYNKEPVWIDFLEHVKGIAGVMTSMLLYYFGYCENAVKGPSSLWSYAGLTPQSKHVKGESSSFNPNLRTLCWKISSQLLKANSPRYRPIYDNEKKRQEEIRESREGETEFTREDGTVISVSKRLGHSHSRALRKMVKQFLADYYRMCFIVKGKKVPRDPYVLDRLGHKPNIIPIEEFIEEEKKRKLTKNAS